MADPLLEKLANYVVNFNTPSHEALKHARLCLADAMGCALLSLNFEECRRLLGPWVPGTIVPGGCRIPGLDYVLDPVMGAFNFGAMVRWLDYNDTFLAKEWAHPSDNIGGLLPLMDFIGQQKPLKVADLLLAIIKAYEIQGALGLENSFNQAGIDHVILVKLALAALSTHLLGGNQAQVIDAISQVFIDLGSTRAYRHAPNTGSRKSWAAGDAAARGVALSLLTLRGEKGFETPLSAPKFGLEAVLFQGKPLTLSHQMGSYIIENILFKVTYPAEYHAQTAVEAAFALRPQIPSLESIESIQINTHEAAVKIIDKKGELKNYADRDHCMQYMVAIALIYGEIKAEHYSDEAAKDPRIDPLRAKITIKEDPTFTQGYHDANLRSVPSELTIKLKDGTILGPKKVEFPLGHKRRREEAIAPLFRKLEDNLSTRYPKDRAASLSSLFQNQEKLENLSITAFVDLFL